MIVFTRRMGEAIVVDDDVVMTVLEIWPDKRIGIDCPEQTPVHRREVWEAIKREEERPCR